MNTADWYAKTVKGHSVNRAAQESGLPQTTLNTQVRNGALRPESVVAIARAYGVDVLDGLVASGLITREDIENHGIRAALADATDKELADAVWARIEAGSTDGSFDESPARPTLTVIDGGPSMSDARETVPDEDEPPLLDVAHDRDPRRDQPQHADDA